MRRTPATTAASLLLAAGLLTGCSNGSDTTATAETKPTKTSAPAKPSPTGVTADCANAVYDLLVENIESGKVPDYRPDPCNNITDAQWSETVAEQSDKLLAAGEAALEDSADTPAASTGDTEGAATSKVTYKVWGDAPAGVDITYGTDSDNLAGTSLPMEKTLKYSPNALYWHVTAQLSGGGSIHCSVTVDGETKKGRAEGDYNICSAQINNL